MITDEVLMEQFKSGQRDALGVLYERHQAELINRMSRILQNREDAADVYNDTFIRIFESPHLYHHREFRPWMFTIAYNLCRSMLTRRTLSRRKVLKPISVVTYGTIFDSGDVHLSEFESRELRPDEAAELHDGIPFMLSCIDLLPEPFQETIVRVKLKLQPYDEAARDMGVPRGTVGSRSTYAMKMLQEMMTA